MRKALVLIFVPLLLFASCGGQKPPDAGEPAAGPVAISAATRRKGPTARTLLARYMPEAMDDGIVKTAIVCNLNAGDHTRQFLEGCISEGRAMGFTVDFFITDGDKGRFRELVGKIAGADYDGLILYHGDADYTYEALLPVLAKGRKVVTFDALPYKNGDPSGEILPGVTSTAQDDAQLARLSLNAILSHVGQRRRDEGAAALPVNEPAELVNDSARQVNGLKKPLTGPLESAAKGPVRLVNGPAEQVNELARPVRVIRVWTGPGLPPLDRRQAVYDEFVRDGKIQEVALVDPRNLTFPRGRIREILAAMLLRLPEHTVDAVWAAHDEYAKGAMDALREAGRKDIVLASVDISNEDIKMMVENAPVWIGAAAVDPGLVGVVNMRLLAAKLAGESTPDTFTFDVQFVQTASLSPETNMANMDLMVSGWGREEGLFDAYPWMEELKAAEGKYLRLPPGEERRRGEHPGAEP